jgi:helix-turn-helix protein
MSVEELLENIKASLNPIQQMLIVLVGQKTLKEYYTVEEIAERVGREPYTVREWCRLGRIRGQKKQSGRGKYPLWVIPHAEMLRYEREGLLPIQRPS